MTPLEQAQQQQKYGCATCAKRVVIHGVSYCGVSGKLLLPSLLHVGQCAHVPSEYEPKGDGMETVQQEMKGDLHINGVKVRENELHAPLTIKVTDGSYNDEKNYCLICAICGKTVGKASMATKRTSMFVTSYCCSNYCPNCGARLKEVSE